VATGVSPGDERSYLIRRNPAGNRDMELSLPKVAHSEPDLGAISKAVTKSLV
jgi:hypothetical protein